MDSAAAHQLELEAQQQEEEELLEGDPLSREALLGAVASQNIELNRLEVLVRELRDALDTYGHHQSRCKYSVSQHGDVAHCTCGLEKAMEQLQ